MMKKRIGVLLAALVMCLLALSVTALAADAQVEIQLRTVTASTKENMVIPKEQLIQMKLTKTGSGAHENLDGYYRKDAAGNWIFYGFFDMPAPSDLTDAAAFLSDNYNTLSLGIGYDCVTLPLTAFQWTALEADPPSKAFNDSDYLLTADLCVYQVRFAKNDGTAGLYDGADYTHYAIKGSVCSSALPAAPTREGYTFDGWYTAAEGGTRATPKNLSSLLTPEADVTTLYAHWTQSSAAEHTHCVCGSTHKDIGDHDAEESKTFTAWNNPTALPSDSGCYYLACDVLLNDAWVPADGVVLCLNGFSIISTSPSNAIYVGDMVIDTAPGKANKLIPNKENPQQRTFTLTDCKDSGEITHRSDCTGEGVWVTGSGTFKMFGGSIAGNLGSGVFVSYVRNDPLRQSTFIMYGGRISGNSGVNSDAGGVDAGSEGSSLTMYGGEISGNSAKDGGGVFVGTDNTFTMYGGKICGNSAERGGGVFFNAYGTLIMSGGEITGNNAAEGGGGVRSWSGKIRVSGSARITDNVTGGTKDAATGLYTGGKTSNVYLGSTSKIAIDDALTDGAHIGVALGTEYSNTKIFTSGWSDKMGGEADPAAYFSSDDAVYHVKKDESGEVKLTANHSHALCAGQTCSDPTHSENDHGSDVGFLQALSQDESGLYINGTKWTADDDGRDAAGEKVMGYRLNGNMEGAAFYLTTDLTLDHSLLIYGGNNHASVTLCLNGHTIRVTTNEPAIQFVRYDGSSGISSLTLCDCVGTGTITHNERAGSVLPNADARIGVEVGGFGRFTMYGGEITGGRTGVVLSAYREDSRYANRSGGEFTMYGGKITGNQNEGSNGYGGGVVVGLPSDAGVTKFTMYGGEITGNRVTASDGLGGGVAIWNNGQFDMKGGEITGNTAAKGGGVWFIGKSDETNGSFTVSGKARIMDNTKDVPADGQYEYSGSWPSNVYLGEGSRITIGGQLVNEAPVGAAIGVTLSSGYDPSKIFTSGWDTEMPDADPAGYFSSDLAGYAVDEDESGEAKLAGTAQSLTFDLNSLITKQLTSDVPFEKLSQTEFTLTFSGGRSHMDENLEHVYDWQLTTTAKATITAGSMTESDGVYTASAPFLFTDNSAQEGAYSLQDGLLTITVPAALLGATAHEFTITETDDGTAGMTYSTTFPQAKLTSDLVIDPRTGLLVIKPKSTTLTYTKDEETKSGELNPELTNGVYRFSSGGITIRNSYTYVAPAPDDSGDLIVPTPKQDKGLLNKDDHTAYLTGYPDGTVRPDDEITRAEVASIFYRLLRDEARTSARAAAKAFSDVPAGEWYHDAVTAMAGLGIVTGYPDGTFRPDQSITRAEFAAILARIEQAQTGADAGFTDVAGHWAAKQIGIACAKGWATGYADGTFRPDRTITRAEAVAMTNRLLERRPESEADLISGMRTWTDNADPAKWYYLDLQEATNSHTYTHKASGYELWQQLKN